MIPPPQVIAVIAILHSRHGRALIADSDLRAAIDALPNAPRLPPSRRDAIARGVAAWLEHHEGSFTLRDEITALIGFELDDDSLALSPEEDAQLVELLRSRSPIALEDINAVTRRFLEDVLAGADIPDELLETIVDTYVRRGTLTMDENGGRYTISLS
jgi:hypothetical protein